MESEHGQLTVGEDGAPRLDAFLATGVPGQSRSRWQQLIKEGLVTVNGIARKANHTLRPGDLIAWQIPPPQPSELVPAKVDFDVLYEDNDVIVINKPPNLLVHPGPGHTDNTLVHGLLHHCDDLAGIGGEERPGIVHRLDRDTSGCLVAAKNAAAHRDLVRQFKERLVHKEYITLVWGAPEPPRGTIKTLFGRDPHNRKKMSARVNEGREAITHYETVQPFGEMTFLRIRIETGRTHQIRVHMQHIRHPVVGDTVYSRAHQHPLGHLITRQMLHAERLSFFHPRTGIELEFTAPIPPDFRALLTALKQTTKR